METLISQYGYWILFPASFFEGQLSTVIAGFLVWTGHFNFWIVFSIILFVDIFADSLYYWIGRRAIKSHRVSIFLDKSDFLSSHLNIMKKLRFRHPIKTMLLGKNAYMISVAIIISAGMAKMPFFRFLLYSIPTSFIQPIILLFLGYHLGNGYYVISQYIKYPGIIIAIVLIIIIVIYRKITKNIASDFEK